MNDNEFRRHLKDLVQSHHHPEEHDWGREAPTARKPDVRPATKRRAPKKSSKRK